VDRRFFSFALFGVLAFGADVLFFYLVGSAVDIPWLQKVAGFVAGVSTTYLLNSAYTFQAPLSPQHYGLYVLSQMGGMAVNLLVFLLVHGSVHTLVALVLATLVGLVVNFLGARRVLSGSIGQGARVRRLLSRGQ
jgi:putative flippase GtrA